MQLLSEIDPRCPACKSFEIQPALRIAGTWQCLTCSAVFQPKHDRDRPIDSAPPRCNQCGREPPTHANGCPKTTAGPVPTAPEHDPTKIVLGFIFNAVDAGGTLILTGPNSVVSPHDRMFGGTLEDASGDRSAHAYGATLGEVLVGLVASWQRSEQLDEHQATHDRGGE